MSIPSPAETKNVIKEPDYHPIHILTPDDIKNVKIEGSEALPYLGERIRYIQAVIAAQNLEIVDGCDPNYSRPVQLTPEAVKYLDGEGGDLRQQIKAKEKARILERNDLGPWIITGSDFGSGSDINDFETLIREVRIQIQRGAEVVVVRRALPLSNGLDKG